MFRLPARRCLINFHKTFSYCALQETSNYCGGDHLQLPDTSVVFNLSTAMNFEEDF